MDYVQISISPISVEESEILVAELSELGFDAFEEGENILHAFVAANIFDEKNVNAFLSPKYSFVKNIIREKNWNEEWEKNFQPIIVDDFCSIRAAFHSHVPGALHDIIITPKMSFGTGHHATTYMMIRAMKEIDFLGKSVFDVGTGTGILAILAETCGAASVLAIDNDEWSIRNAEENIHLNRAVRITVEKRDSTRGTGVFDIILANINKNFIVENLSNLQQHLSDDGVLLISGFLQQDLSEIEREAEKNNLIISAPPQFRENWHCLKLKKSTI